MAQLHHPNIVSIYDIGYEQNQPFFAMELIEGEPLKEFGKQASLSIRQIVEIIKKLGNAMAYAHSAGIQGAIEWYFQDSLLPSHQEKLGISAIEFVRGLQLLKKIWKNIDKSAKSGYTL